jgi:hypothetical protein
MNRTEHRQRIALHIDGLRTVTELPRRSIATYLA